MASKIRKIGPIGWFLCAFLIWSVAFVSARATGTNLVTAPRVPENSAALRKLAQVQVGTPARPSQTPATPSGPAPPGTYAENGAKTCLDCHDSEPATLILQTPHAVKADGHSPFAQHQCETCHGPSPEHIADPSKYSVTVVYAGNDKSPAPKRNEMCSG